LAITGTSRALRLRGFRLLKTFGVFTPETMQELIRVLSARTDPENFQAAIEALPREVVYEEEASALVRAVLPFVSSADVSVRATVADRIYRWWDWVQEEVRIGTALRLLDDPSAEVRERVARSLFWSDVKRDSMLARKLEERMTDPGETRDVRVSAQYALQRCDYVIPDLRERP
jgi:hypothetical protein